MTNPSRSAITALSIAFFAGGCGKSLQRQHVSVSGPVHLVANVAVTLTSPVPLLAPNYWNALCLQPRASNALASSALDGNMPATVRQFAPKVYLRNAAGTEDAFELSTEMGSIDGLWLCFEQTSPKRGLHPPYVEVKIISPTDFELNGIKWHSSDK